jgi:hypothetical protein
MTDKTGYDGWAILELLGHVRLAGRVTEESHFGVALGRIDIPASDGYTTQYFGGSSIYRLTPTTEEIARSVALQNQPAPVRTWELPKPQQIEVDRAASEMGFQMADTADRHDEDFDDDGPGNSM